jgi:predicted RNase H-related nuclease YkuK (DUF458 family)
MSNISYNVSFVPYTIKVGVNEEVTTACITGLDKTGFIAIIVFTIIGLLAIYFYVVKEGLKNSSLLLKIMRIVLFSLVLLNGVLLYYTTLI